MAIQPATIMDVAALAGVSISTVSRALNRPGLVTAKTRARVMRAVKKLDFHPNAFAQSLGRSRCAATAVHPGAVGKPRRR